jgi:flagella basal body P-ring formation protein FlgA
MMMSLAAMTLVLITANSIDLRDIVEKSLPEKLTAVEVELPKGVNIPDGAGITVIWQRLPRPGPGHVILEVAEAQRPARRVHARVRLAEMKSVVVAKRAIGAGAKIGSADLTIERRLADGTGGFEADVLIGLETQKAIAKGELLDRTNVALPAPLPRGTAVSVVFRSGPLEVATKGILDRSTRIGEEAVVRAQETHRIVKGRLVGPTTVLIEGDAR